MTRWIDSTNYKLKDETGWSDLDWLDGYSAAGFLGWVYEWEACQKDVGAGPGTVEEPSLARIQKFAKRVAGCEYAVLDIESPKAHFASPKTRHLMARYLRTAQVAAPHVKWFWYNTQQPIWEFTQKFDVEGAVRQRTQLAAWRRDWDRHRSCYDVLERGMVSFYPSITEQLQWIPFIVREARRMFGNRELFWNMSLQRHDANPATSPFKPAKWISREMEILQDMLERQLIDYVSVWGLFNDALPIRSLEKDVVDTVAGFVEKK